MGTQYCIAAGWYGDVVLHCCYFLPLRFILLHFLQSLSKQKLQNVWNCEQDFYLWLSELCFALTLITETVDWTLKNNYLSARLPQVLLDQIGTCLNNQLSNYPTALCFHGSVSPQLWEHRAVRSWSYGSMDLKCSGGRVYIPTGLYLHMYGNIELWEHRAVGHRVVGTWSCGNMEQWEHRAVGT